MLLLSFREDTWRRLVQAHVGKANITGQDRPSAILQQPLSERA